MIIRKSSYPASRDQRRLGPVPQILPVGPGQREENSGKDNEKVLKQSLQGRKGWKEREQQSQ